jgi:hypothetical protein
LRDSEERGAEDVAITLKDRLSTRTVGISQWGFVTARCGSSSPRIALRYEQRVTTTKALGIETLLPRDQVIHRR